MLMSSEFTQAIAPIAMHTRRWNYEGGFTVQRTAGRVVLNEPFVPISPLENGGRSPAETLALPDADNEVASAHTHPFRRPLHNRDYTNHQPSLSDLARIGRMGRVTEGYVMGIVVQDGLRAVTENGLVMSLYRSAQQLPHDDEQLKGDYLRALTGDFDQNLTEIFGVRAARIGFNVVRSGPRRRLSIEPNRQWDTLQTGIKRLFEG